MRYRTVEDAISVFVFIESEVDEGTNPASALRRAIDTRRPDCIAERVVRIDDWRRAPAAPIRAAMFNARLAAASSPPSGGAIAQESVQVASGGEAYACDRGIFRGVDDLVDMV